MYPCLRRQGQLLLDGECILVCPARAPPPPSPHWLQSFAGPGALVCHPWPESSCCMTLPCFLFLGKSVPWMQLVDHFSIHGLSPQVQTLLGTGDFRVSGLSQLTNAVISEVPPFLSAHLPPQQCHSFHPGYPTPAIP